MEYLRRFDNNYDYENFLENTDNLEKYNNYSTKMFYLEEDEKMIIGSGKRDIVLDLKNLNQENSNYTKVNVLSTSDENLTVNIYYKKLNKGQYNINLASVIGGSGYVVDENNSQVRMILDNSDLYTTLVKNVDWTYNYANGVITLLRPIEGNIIINFKSVLYTDLLDNNFKLYISKNGGNREILYDNNIINEEQLNLFSGDEYEITGEVLSGGNINVALKSGINYCKVNGNLLYPIGYKNGGGQIIVGISSNIYNGYKPVDINIQFNVSLEYAQVFNLDECIPSEIIAGNQIDLRGLRVSAGCTFFVETTQRIQTTDVDLVYNTVGNGSESTQKVTIHINGNETCLSNTISKDVRVKLKTNNIKWGVIYYNGVPYNESLEDFNSSTHKFNNLEEIDAGAGSSIAFNVISENEGSNVIYTVSPTAYGNIVGNLYYPTLPDGYQREVTVTAKVPASGDYSVSEIRAKFMVKPITVEITEYVNSDTNFYGGNKYNLNIKYTNPSIPINPQFTIVTNSSNLFVIEGEYLKVANGFNMQGVEHNIKVRTTIRPGNSYGETTEERIINCKLRPIDIYFPETNVFYANVENKVGFKILDTLLVDNNNLYEVYWRDYGSNIGQNKIELRYGSVNYSTEEQILNNWSNLNLYDLNVSYELDGSLIRLKTIPDLTNRPNLKYIYIRFNMPAHKNYESKLKVFKFSVQE